jgi:lysophospholipase L1-like esterase
MKAAYSKDGVHPNKEGYKVMEVLAEEAIKKALKSR